MNTPYIKVSQKGEVFFLTKFKASELKKLVHFHVRDPYKNLNMDNKYDSFMKKLEAKNINFKESDKGVQRRLTLNRVNEIKKYIENNENFLPNTVILSVDITTEESFQNNYLEYESKEVGYFEFDENAEFMIVDGQHRLAGIFSVDDRLLNEIEIPAVILFNITISTAAKLFADINGKVKPVNRSLIYDLYEEIDDEEYGLVKRIHMICKAFYESKNSPLYRQIKMLGIGNGAISQAFFIDYVKEAVKKARMEELDTQEIFNHFYYYFSAFQYTFPEDWPIKREMNNEDNEEYAKFVLKDRKSQLVKTNGFGAIMNLFPLVYDVVKDKEDLYNSYRAIIEELSGKIEWNSVNYQGTGRKFQNIIYHQLKEILFSQKHSQKN